LDGFQEAFAALNGDGAPFLWQERMFQCLAGGDIPPTCDIPTGLGKTSVIAIWLLALEWQARERSVRLPRRLVYVVDRRTVVDQATDVAERLRKALKEAAPESPAGQVRAALERLCIDPNDPDSPLAIGTLRGEHADNGAWRADPSRPAIVVGTVDMIGSRLLFSGYGVSRRMRPFQAGLLGQDTLIVHDEAHLSPAFGSLIGQIRRVQTGAGEPRPIQVMELSATQRDGAATEEVFALTKEEEAEERVAQRLGSAKTLHFVRLEEKEALADTAVRQAGALEETHPQPKRVVVYVTSPKDAAAIAARLETRFGRGRVALLTGTIRGHERDQMASPAVRPEDIVDAAARRRAEIFRGFRARPNRAAPDETEYLVSTSAGEVGVDLDADHMIADLSTLDSIIQRLGRVNRLGEGAAQVVVIVPSEATAGAVADDRALRLAATYAVLQSLQCIEGGHDASPKALRTLVQGLGEEKLAQCFSKRPRLLELTDILLDGRALTRVEKLPGRPPVDRWLHGVGPEPPSTYVAWRREISEIVGMEEPVAALKTLLDKHRILGRERVRGARDDVIEELKTIAKRLGERKVVLVPPRSTPEAVLLDDLLKKDGAERLREATVVLPPEAGGLSLQGMLDGSVKEPALDVADWPRRREQGKANGDRPHTPERLRVIVARAGEDQDWTAHRLDNGTALDLLAERDPKARPNRVVRTVLRILGNLAVVGQVPIAPDDESGHPERVLLLLSERKSLVTAEDNPAAAPAPRSIEDHHRDICEGIRRLLASLGPLSPAIAEMTAIADGLILAAARHDNGKNRDPWQADIGNARQGDGWMPLAKSGRRGFVSYLSGDYRHEFGSLREAQSDPALADHPERDLILHLIAAHHGWARPHFEERHWDIADDVAYGENDAVAAKAMQRYARLQRRFGRWGLAWLESLLRAADYRAGSGIAPEWRDLTERAP
jgi:CRISPR-associated endonuclease/helicase Cas3